jgi:hypothetical protein
MQHNLNNDLGEIYAEIEIELDQMSMIFNTYTYSYIKKTDYTYLRLPNAFLIFYYLYSLYYS